MTMRKASFLVATLLATHWLSASAASAKTAEVTITSPSPAAVAAFKEARDLLDNVRIPEGAAGMKKAIELDASFALAHAYLGSVTPGAAGLQELEKASALAAKLPDAEKLEIQALLAGTRGEELNSLGYVYLVQEKSDEAIATFKKYSEVLPKEPNPYDSLAEAQMGASHLAEAEASFQKAFAVSPEFYIALQGVAQTRFLRNDWSGGKDALDQAQAAATRPVDRLGLEFNRAWSLAAAGQLDQAMKTF